VLGTVPAWLVALGLSRAYDIGPFGTDPTEMRRVVSAAAHFLAVIAVGYYVLHLQRLGRGFLIVIIPLATGFTLVGRFAARGWLQAQRSHGRMVRRAVLLGPRAQAEALASHLQAHLGTGIRPIAALVPEDTPALTTGRGGVPVIGTPDHVMEALASTNADLLLITASLGPGELRKLTWQLEGTGIDVIVAPTMGPTVAPRFDVRPVAGLPLLYIDRAKPTAGPGRGDL
jgi:FlaA1/EpsC-like NDP-sugar epimerase